MLWPLHITELQASMLWPPAYSEDGLAIEQFIILPPMQVKKVAFQPCRKKAS